MALTHVAANLAGTHWNLKTLDGATVANDERPLSISFDENRINGYAGCNSFFGNYTASGDDVFSSGSVGTTKMACLGERDQLERHYLEQLAQAKQYVISRDQLHLLDAQTLLQQAHTQKRLHKRQAFSRS